MPEGNWINLVLPLLNNTPSSVENTECHSRENTESLISNLKEENKQLLDILLNGKSALWRLKRLDDEHPIVSIYTLTGKKIPVPIQKYSTVTDIKKEFQKITNVPFYRQRLIFGGIQLLNHRSIFQLH